MHLDNSSCNLASLNLLKFLREDGTFDAELFVKAVELVITAMDISICFADFPTEPIAETTRKFRQLGIGYANLGALLMATGHAYDSEGGRCAGRAITSLMTGGVLPAFGRTGRDRGSLRGLRPQRRAHQRVMRKHAAANELVRTYHTQRRRRSGSWRPGVEAKASSSAGATVGATPRPACSPRPAPSAS
jgi:ribonucleoside-diphosphate reductase alpha chain